LRYLLPLLLLGCGGGPTALHTEHSPADALEAAHKTLTEAGYTLAPAPANTIRTVWHCLTQRGTRQGGIDWAASYGSPTLGPLPFEQVGPPDDDTLRGGRCASIFRVEITARATAKGSTLHPEAAWYRARRGRCTPEGNPLLGQTRCAWRYVGAQAEGDATRNISLALRDL
jgi:hypothetical protein